MTAARQRPVQLFAEDPKRAIVPFLAVALVAIGSILLPPYASDGRDVLLAVVALVCTTVLACSVPFLPRTHWVVGLPPLLFFVVIAFLRNATGGEASGFVTLILLPVTWIVLYGTRRQLMQSAAATALLFLLPAILIRLPLYSGRSWRVGLTWVLFIVLVCPMLQRTVERLRVSEKAQRDAANELGSVLRAATEHSIIATDLAGRITVFSDGAERMLGYRRADVVGHLNWSLLHDPEELRLHSVHQGLAPWASAITSAASGETLVSRNWTYRRQDGRSLRVRLTVTPLLSDHQEQVGWIGIARDITAEERAQRELAMAERRWRTLLDNLPDLSVLVVGADLRYQVAVGAGLRRQGPEGVQGRSLRESSSAENVLVLEGIYRRALAGSPGTAEIMATHTGAINEITVTPLPQHDGEPEALVVARDVTESRRNEAELRTARDHFARLFEETPHGTLLLDTHGRVSQINSALCLMLRDRADNLLGRDLLATPLADLIEAPALTGLLNGETHRLVLDRALRGRPDEMLPVTELLAAEEFMYVSVTFVPLRNSDGNIDSLLATVVDVSERRRYEQQLARLAETDPLTGLANRRKFDAALTAHLDECRLHGPKGALLLMDLDNFKQTNDTLGHTAGDQLIISVAAALQGRLRSTDVIARLGGDEFAILLPDADRATTARVAQDIVHMTRETPRLLDGTRTRSVTSSVGAVVIEDATVTAGELLSTADMTMYDAKDAGRNRYVLHDRDTFSRPRTRTRIAWADRIVRALEDDSFTVHAQPILDLSTNRIESAELLIRMNADDGTLILPGMFLPVAERTNLITDIDCLMLERARDALRTVQQIDPNFSLSVNISGASIGDLRIAELIGSLAADETIDPRGLVLEITETAAISDIETARSFAEVVRDLGCRFALDDFGAGFGSFYYLKHLLFDYVKIDGEFVAESVANATDRLIIASIVDIAKGLGKQTIAEYVSDEKILEVVRGLGVDHAQGFHVGGPRGLDQLYSDLRREPSPSRQWSPRRNSGAIQKPTVVWTLRSDKN